MSIMCNSERKTVNDRYCDYITGKKISSKISRIADSLLPDMRVSKYSQDINISYLGKGPKKKSVKVWSLTKPADPPPLCLSVVFLS